MLNDATVQFVDFKGNGTADILVKQSGQWKYYESDTQDGWQRPVNFVTAPTESLLAKAYFTDLTGNGSSDALILTGSNVSFMKCSARGFEKPVTVSGSQLSIPSFKHPSIKMADITGDGLKDVIQVNSNTSEIKYWANLGYGRFSAARPIQFITAAPRLTPEDLPNIFFIDVAGTGQAALVFIDIMHKKVVCWLNLNAESFAAPFEINIPPSLFSQNMQVQPLDLTGLGGAGLLFSTPALGTWSHWHLQFGDTTRAFLLKEVNNNMGLITRFSYESSTHHYLKNGNADWYFPFPIQVISKIEKIDSVQQTRYSRKFEYFQGYYDSFERELVGFGRVEEYDSEQFDDIDRNFQNNNKDYFVPPLKTTTWYHTGRDEQRQAGSYFKEDPEISKITLAPSLPADASGEDKRSLRGKKVRMESCVAGIDPADAIPYKIEQYNYSLQSYPVLGNTGSITGVVPKETLISIYETNTIDPRVSHSVVTDTDLFGNVRTVVSLSYPRRGQPVYDEQKRIYATLNENFYTEVIDNDISYLAPNVSETFVYQVEGVASSAGALIDFDTLRQSIRNLNKALVEHKKTIYWNQHIDAALPKGTIAEHGLVFKTYEHGFTEDLLKSVMAGHLPDDFLGKDGVLVKEEGFELSDDVYWRAKASQVYDPGQFFLPTINIAPNGALTHITYDKLRLFPEKTQNPFQRQVNASYDYAVGKPVSITDINDNKAYFTYNALGLLTSIIYTGKSEDDSDTRELPSVKFQYQFKNQPIYAAKYEKVMPGRQNTIYREEIEYKDGLGRSITKKVKTGYQENIKWITQGKKTYNNKGDIVQEFAPYYSDDATYNATTDGNGQGLSTRIYYDIQGRVIKKVFPDDSSKTTSYTAWDRTESDENDNDPDSPHFNTPVTSYLDPLGRVFLISQKLNAADAIEERRVLDPKDRPLQIKDALGRMSFQYKYDLTGELLYTKNIDKGEEWTITNVAKSPVYQHNILGTKRLQYDLLNRLIKVWEQDRQQQRLSSFILYGEEVKNASTGNFNGRKFLQFDKAGLELYTGYSHKGDLLGVSRKFTKDAAAVVNWSAETQLSYEQIEKTVKLDTTPYVQVFSYNSLNQLIAVTAPGNRIVRYKHNLSGQLVSIDITQEGRNAVYLKNIEYNARGQRDRMTKGDNCITKYSYSPTTFRLTALVTTSPSQEKIQDITYDYDKVGNIEKITDLSQPTIFFKNVKVDLALKFRYDSLYRLIEASGRKRGGNPFLEQWTGMNCNENNDQAVSSYTERYAYDKAGNIQSCTHVSAGERFVTKYQYDDNYATNALRQILNGQGETLEHFQYDGCGNAVQMKHLTSLHWDPDGRLMQVELGGGGTQFYSYDLEGKRIRKVTRRLNGTIEESIYLGVCEVFFQYQGSKLTQKTESLVIEAGSDKLLILDKKNNQTITRYQLTNHLGSVSAETDDTGNVISYEEFYPFGKTALRFCSSNISYKKYRYIGKEQDTDTGMYYIGARYYSAACCRWISVDPLMDKMSIWSPYVYCFNNPVKLFDAQGKEAADFGTTLLGKEPDFIPQRELEYRFSDLAFQQNKSDVKWPMAAAKVSHAMNEIAHPNVSPFLDVNIPNFLFKLIGIDMEPVTKLAETGNRQIFNDAWPKLNFALSGPRLTGLGALKWDAKMLWEEQMLVQPLYDQASKTTITILELGSKQNFPLAGLAISLKGIELGPFPKNGSLTDILQRWDYGMGEMYNASFRREGLIPAWFLPGPKEEKKENNLDNKLL